MSSTKETSSRLSRHCYQNLSTMMWSVFERQSWYVTCCVSHCHVSVCHTVTCLCVTLSRVVCHMLGYLLGLLLIPSINTADNSRFFFTFMFTNFSYVYRILNPNLVLTSLVSILSRLLFCVFCMFYVNLMFRRRLMRV